MLILILNAFSVLGIEAFLFSKSDACISEDASLNCFCKQKENITLTAILDFEITQITVKDCGFVTIPLGAITHLQLMSISLTDIEQLDILPFAFVGVQEIQSLRIENIRKFNVQKHGFVGLYNVSNVIIRNVTSEKIAIGSFGAVSNIQNFLIANSVFQEIQETAFVMTNITNFTISDSKLRSLANISFLLHNSESVTFENCDIEETRNNTFTMSFVENLNFINCRFGIIASTFILSSSLEEFTFSYCTVEQLQTDAFALVDASKYITFTHNTIKLADEYSLIPSTGTFNSKKVEIENCCNSFTCDCNIYWLWLPEEGTSYDSFLKNSFCLHKPETNLSSLQPVLDSNKNCMTLELEIFHNNFTIKKIHKNDSFELRSGKANAFLLNNVILNTLNVFILYLLLLRYQ